MTSRTGRVVTSVGGFHMVSFRSGEKLLCRARGRLKLKGSILAGDHVSVAVEDGEGVIEKVAPRTTELVRPAVANVAVTVVVMAVAHPEPALDLLDRILALAEKEGLRAVLVWNKVDLVPQEQVGELTHPYTAAGYPVVMTSAKDGTGIDALGTTVGDQISVLSGPSGVGKSSLLNALIPGAELKTRSISEKGVRGRHTTRQVSLLRLPQGGWVADAPGFSTLTLGTMDPRLLPDLYPDFVPLASGCRFSGCLHREEPGCAVKTAQSQGDLDPGRYARYLRLLREVEQAYERRY